VEREEKKMKVNPKNCIDNLDLCKAACCKFMFYDAINLTEDRLKYFRIHGFIVKKLEVNKWRILIPAKCSKLTEDNKCGIHESKPLDCKSFGELTGSDFWLPDECIYK